MHHCSYHHEDHHAEVAAATLPKGSLKLNMKLKMPIMMRDSL
jgi:hypothetical protein